MKQIIVIVFNSRSKTTKQEQKEKLASAMESLPQSIASATQAARDHSMAIKKWAKTLTVDLYEES